MAKRNIPYDPSLINKANSGIELEYGVPLDTVPYEVRTVITDLDMDQEVINDAADVVESEAKQGRFAAFVVRRSGRGPEGADLLDVWVPQS